MNLIITSLHDPIYSLIHDDITTIVSGQKTLQLIDAFAVERAGESERFAKWSTDSNRMLLWHGSRLANFGGRTWWVNVVGERGG